MIIDLDCYRESKELQQHGVAVELALGWKVFLRRFGTPEAGKVYAEIKERLYGFISDDKEISHSLIFAWWLSEYGVSGWTGAKDQDGNEIPYTKQAARDIFHNESYWLSLNARLSEAATSFEYYLESENKEEIEQLKKRLSSEGNGMK